MVKAPKQELADLAWPMPLHDGGESLDEMIVRLDLVQLPVFYEGDTDDSVLDPGFVTYEESVLATDGMMHSKVLLPISI